jgi:hypothetical protein
MPFTMGFGMCSQSLPIERTRSNFKTLSTQTEVFSGGGVTVFLFTILICRELVGFFTICQSISPCAALTAKGKEEIYGLLTRENGADSV